MLAADSCMRSSGKRLDLGLSIGGETYAIMAPAHRSPWIPDLRWRNLCRSRLGRAHFVPFSPIARHLLKIRF
jgi:hypothetical protein